MQFKNSLRWRMLFSVMSSTIIVFLIIFGVMYVFSRNMIIDDIEQIGNKEVKLYAGDIDKVLVGVEQSAYYLARLVEKSPYDKEYILSILETMVSSKDDIFGGTVAYEPYAFNSKEKFFAPYYYEKYSKLAYLRIGRDSYDYFTWDWYALVKRDNKAIWKEPYFDEGAGNILMATYSSPFYLNESKIKVFGGVVTADVALTWLEELLSSVVIEKTGYAFMISKKDGKLISYPDKNFVMKKTIFDIATEKKDKSLLNLAHKMMKLNSGFFPYTEAQTGKKYWIAFSDLKVFPAVIGILYPEKEVMAEMFKFNAIVLFIALVGGIALFIVIYSIAVSIIDPISELVRTTEKISNGDLDAEVPHRKVQDEIEFLANSFENMKISLKEYINELTETTIREQKASSELRVAHDIQMSILPKNFPPFPEDNRFDIFALIQPAKEVGGDLYDFFYISENKICFVIGDVSGKGVPASLFMAVTKTLIKATALPGRSPSEILKKVNKELLEEKQNLLFVTVFLGILDLITGEVVYSNAGHNPPVCIQENGQMLSLDKNGGIVLGIEEQADYSDESFFLKKGERIFLYTDGVTEAMDGKGGFFGDEKIPENLTKLEKLSIKAIVYGILKEITVFAENTTQSDDITIMCLEYIGKE